MKSSMADAVNLEKWIWLAEILGAGNSSAEKLLEHFKTIDSIYSAGETDYKRASCGLRDKVISDLCDKSLKNAADILEKCRKKGFRVITYESEEYPERLKNIPAYPLVLYAKGKRLEVDTEAAIAIVGTRDTSPYGESAARKISREIAQMGGIVVSGLAKGIDAIAVDAAVSSGGKAIGVLGCGLDVYYPKENTELIDATAQAGTILSEYPPGTHPTRFTFPLRNRIISGLCLGTIVVEAPERSGALITARHTLEQNRDLFAVPSGIFDVGGEGTNRLIKEGAMPVTSGKDVLVEYKSVFGNKLNFDIKTSEFPIREKKEPVVVPVTATKEKKQKEKFVFPDNCEKKFSEDDMAILKAISDKEMQPDEIAKISGLPIQKVLALITLLEIRGNLQKLAGNRFKIKDLN